MRATTMRARANRWRRSCGFDGNDLWRDVDRRQWRLGLLLLMVFLSATPPLCAHVVQAVYGSGVRTEHHQGATRHRVEAITTAAGAGIGLATGLPLLGLYRLARKRCDRRRYQLWDVEWARFDNYQIGP
jgi:hypothetical protein